MPTRAALLEAGRPDLANLILRVGGFTQVSVWGMGTKTSGGTREQEVHDGSDELL